MLKIVPAPARSGYLFVVRVISLLLVVYMRIWTLSPFCKEYMLVIDIGKTVFLE